MTPIPCGNVTVYCPVGSSGPVPVAVGYYSGPDSAAVDSKESALECPPGAYCVGGVRVLCPPGTFQSGVRKSNISDCAVCTAGGWCGQGVASPSLCGNDSVYCPVGSSQPVPAGSGYFTQGFSGSRSSKALCDPGWYCPSDGRAYQCPAGYGQEGDLWGWEGLGR